MNIFFVYNDILYTAPLDSGTILHGVTRESVIHIANDQGYTVKEEALTIDTVIEGIQNNTLQECFGAGTAASIAPIGCLYYQGEEYIINDFQIGEVSKTLYDELIGIQYGLIEDPYDWTISV